MITILIGDALDERRVSGPEGGAGAVSGWEVCGGGVGGELSAAVVGFRGEQARP
jgi:hypothetical protein